MGIGKIKGILEEEGKDWLDDVFKEISDANEKGKKSIVYSQRLTIKQMQIMDKKGFKVNIRPDGRVSISWELR
jgi:hypothetical protein